MLKKGSKKGATSFYIVAFSTLILVVIATSYAMMAMSEMTRTMNDDLSQSAYDSALAGIEDAEVAFANYQRCLEAGDSAPNSCKKIMEYMKNPDCNMVGKMLYGDAIGDNGEVALGGVATTSNGKTTTTNQAYTCVRIITDVSDYRSVLGSKVGKYVETIRAGVADGGTNTVDALKFSWYTVKNTGDLESTPSYLNIDGAGKPVFPTADKISVPPTIELQIVQTAEKYRLDQFDEAKEGETNRATLYLVPSEGTDDTRIEAKDVAKTNNHHATNKPFVVSCNGDGEFYCTATIELPKAIGGTDTAYRANDTFLISVSIPYEEPDTDFALELICYNDDDCGGVISGGTEESGGSKIVRLKKAQVAIDSTGRANDLVRRVEARLEPSDTLFGVGTQSPYYALMVKDGVTKKMTVTTEKNFNF